MRVRNRARSSGFSLIELVMVVVIIALVGAIAIPRLSRGSAGAAASALVGDLEAMNKALDLYSAEHGGTFPDINQIASQLTTFTDASGNASATSDSTHLYGPYLRAIPPLPLGTRKGAAGIAAADATNVGWIYDASAGVITANSSSIVVVGGGGVSVGGGGHGTTGGAAGGAAGGALTADE